LGIVRVKSIATPFDTSGKYPAHEGWTGQQTAEAQQSIDVRRYQGEKRRADTGG
jgi:hypothetical protein